MKLKVETVKGALPGIKGIGTLYSSGSKDKYNELSAACKAKGCALHAKKVEAAKDFSGALAEISSLVNCFIVIADSKLFNVQTIKFLLLESFKNNIAVIGLSSFFTKAGAIMSIECDYMGLGIQLGEMAEKILGGASPSALKIWFPRKVVYSINTQTAAKLGFTIPPNVLNEAKEKF
jgi:putative ABC transport system substrate-binding protein